VGRAVHQRGSDGEKNMIVGGGEKKNMPGKGKHRLIGTFNLSLSDPPKGKKGKKKYEEKGKKGISQTSLPSESLRGFRGVVAEKKFTGGKVT